MKRALMPYGGIRMAKGALEAYGFKIDQKQTSYLKIYLRHITKVYLMHTQAKS